MEVRFDWVCTQYFLITPQTPDFGQKVKYSHAPKTISFGHIHTFRKMIYLFILIQKLKGRGDFMETFKYIRLNIFELNLY